MMICHYCKATPDAWAYSLTHEPRLVCPAHHRKGSHVLLIVTPL